MRSTEDSSIRSTAEIGLTTRGRVGDRDTAEVTQVLGAVLQRHEAATAARVRLTGTNCAGGPLLVQVNLRVCGAPARVQVGGYAPEVIEIAAHRLDRQILRLSTIWEQWLWPDPERGVLGALGPGRITRRKRFRLRVGRPCQAAAALAAMDYDVHLFTDAATGEDAIVYRAGPAGLRLARQHDMRPPSLPTELPMTVNALPTPTIALAEAVDRLGRYGLPFLFFSNADTGRGNLVYRRYDGNLGHISPNESDRGL